MKLPDSRKSGFPCNPEETVRNQPGPIPGKPISLLPFAEVINRPLPVTVEVADGQRSGLGEDHLSPGPVIVPATSDPPRARDRAQGGGGPHRKRIPRHPA